jgi:hypothetical protein
MVCSSSSGSPAVPSHVRGLIQEAIQHTANVTVARTIADVESRRIQGLTQDTTQLSFGMIAVVIQLVERALLDRSLTTQKKLYAALGGVLRIYRRAGIDGRGPRAGFILPTTAAEEDHMKAAVVSQLNLRFREFNVLPVPGSPHLGCGLLPDSVWRMSLEFYASQCSAYELDDNSTFVDTERRVYTEPCTAGTDGCAGAHVDAALFLLWVRAAYMLVLENDANITSVQARTLFRAIDVVHQDPVLRDVVDMIVLHGEKASPCGHQLKTEKFVADITGPGGGKGRIYLWWASMVSGSAAYLLTARGAAKLINSGFHLALFCKDDFWNACNFHRRNDHFNPAIHNLPCVQHVIAAGGLRILRITPSPVTLDKASDISDTRYPISE